LFVYLIHQHYVSIGCIYIYIRHFRNKQRQTTLVKANVHISGLLTIRSHISQGRRKCGKVILQVKTFAFTSFAIVGYPWMSEVSDKKSTMDIRRCRTNLNRDNLILQRNLHVIYLKLNRLSVVNNLWNDTHGNTYKLPDNTNM